MFLHYHFEGIQSENCLQLLVVIHIKYYEFNMFAKEKNNKKIFIHVLLKNMTFRIINKSTALKFMTFFLDCT